MSDNQITANFDNKVDFKEFKFHFKSVEDKASGIKTKRPTIELKLPVPSVEGIIAILEGGGKGLELLLAASTDIILAQARSILNDDEQLSSETFPLTQCAWDFIANMPEAEKRGRGIPKEMWEEFVADYVEVMPAVTGKSAEQVALAAKLFLQKFQPVKTNKPILQKLREQLAVYMNNSKNAEQYVDCIKFLDEKVNVLLTSDVEAAYNL